MIKENLFPYITYQGHTELRNKVIGDSPDGKQQAVLTEDQELKFTLQGVPYKVIMKALFLYDMATVPGIVTFIKSARHHHLNPNTTLKDVSGWHDGSYINTGLITLDTPYIEAYKLVQNKWKRCTLRISREETDWLYYLGLEWDQDQLLVHPSNVWKSRSMTEKETWGVYKGLKQFGWAKWNKKIAKKITKISRFIHKLRLLRGRY